MKLRSQTDSARRALEGHSRIADHMRPVMQAGLKQSIQYGIPLPGSTDFGAVVLTTSLAGGRR